MADITITGLTKAQVEILVGEDLTKYITSFADHLIEKKARDEKDSLIRVLIAKTPEELAIAAAPIIEAEKVRIAAEEVVK